MTVALETPKKKESCGLQPGEFEALCSATKRFIETTMAGWKDLIPGIARLSREQLREYKQRFAIHFGADRIERWWLYAAGICPEYLANANATLPAGALRLASRKALEAIQDGSQTVDVFDPNGQTRTRRLMDLGRKDWTRVWDPTCGLLEAEIQKKRMVTQLRNTPVVDEGDEHAVHYEALHIIHGEKGSVKIVMKYKDSDGTDEVQAFLHIPTRIAARLAEMANW